MENIRIGIIAANDYRNELMRAINENYDGINIRFINIENTIKYIDNLEDDLVIIEWEELINSGALVNLRELDKKKYESVIFLVRKIPVEDNKFNEFLKGKIVLSKFSSIKDIIGEGKIIIYSQKTARGFAEDLEKTMILSALMFDDIRSLCESVKTLGNEEKTLIISLKRWVQDEYVSNKNNLRRYFFFFSKNKDGVSYSIDDFVEEIFSSIFKFNYDRMENPIFYIDNKEVISMCDYIRKTKKFTQIIFDLGDCSYKGSSEILNYSRKVIVDSSEQGGILNKKALEKEILKDVNIDRIYTN